MKYGFKYILKKIMPPPINVFNREVGNIKAAVSKQENSLRNVVATQNENIKSEFIKQDKYLGDLLAEQKQEVKDAISAQSEEFRRLLSEQREYFEHLIAEQNRGIENSVAVQNESFKRFVSEQHKFFENAKIEQTAMLSKRQEMFNSIEKIAQKTIEGQRYAAEAVWAHVFKDTIKDSEWLKDQTFSPGRWAAGYPYLYILYRVLNEAHPKRVLELGLGQTTRMIAQYAAAHSDVKHFVVENDPSWIEFFENGYKKLSNTEIVQLDLEMVRHENVEGIRTYKGFAERFRNQQFDLICVDAPWAGDMTHYGRIDILSIIPACLSNDFVIIVDDYDRRVEQKTVEEVLKTLKHSNIEYKSGIYRGKRDTALICAKHRAFLSSM